MKGYLQIVEADSAANAFHTLGGAGYTTMAETRRRFAAIPEVVASELILDLIRGEDSIIEDKFISAATAERLLGRSIDEARADAIADEAAVIAEWEKGRASTPEPKP